MNSTTALKWCLPLIALLSLSGCLNSEMRQKIDADVPVVQAGANKAKAPANTLDYDPLVVTNKVWTGNRAMRMRHGLPLPVTFEGQHSMTMVSGKSMSLPDIASYVSQQTGVPVRLVDGAEKVVGGPVGAGAMGASMGGAAPVDGSSSISSSSESAGPDLGMKVSYQGPLSGFLDNMSSYFGVSWRYDGAAIIVSRFETRTFTVEAMSSSLDYSDGISGGGDGGGGGASQMTGSIEQKNTFAGKGDYWGELEGAVNTILSGVGTVKASPAAGTITIITTPEIMRTVAQYIGQENERSTRQVAVTVELFTLSLDNSESFQSDVNLVYSRLGTGSLANLGLNGPPTPLSAGADGNVFGASIVSPTSRWYGSRALVQALSTIGNVSRVARIPLTTLNNRPATRRIGRDIAYVAEQSTTTTSGSDVVSPTLTPGTVQEGFSLQVTPRIMGDGRLLVQFSLSVTDLIQLAQFPPTGTPQIQLPETASRVFVQQAMLNDGDTLVLAGFDQDQKSADNSGFLSPFNMLLGGSSKAGNTHEMLFLTVTPHEIDVPHRQMIESTSAGLSAGSY